MAEDLTIEKYLEEVGKFCQSSFGLRFRQQFRDTRGTAELGMLKAPTQQEYQQFCRVVEVMAESEKFKPELLDDNDISSIAERAQVDRGITAILINGFVLARKPGQCNG